MPNEPKIPELVSGYDYGEFWGKIWRDVHYRDGIITIVFCGKRGKGKSRSMCQIARILDCGPEGVSRFKPEDVCFDVESFLRKIKGKYPIGKVHVLDDAGLHMYKSDALTQMLKTVSKVLQGIRYKHPIIMLSLPHFKQLVLDARSMCDIYIQMDGIDRSIKKAIGKIQILSIAPFTSELYRINLKKRKVEFNPNSGINTIHWGVPSYEFSKPPKEFDAVYEKLKNSAMDEINDTLIENAISLKDNEIGKTKKMPFSEAVAYVKDRIDEVKDKKGNINVSKIMLLKDEEGNDLFTACRARHIGSALR